MSEARLSILGLYNYGQINNDDLFENLNLPNGIDKDDIVNNILEQCAEFETLYPDYDYMKFSIGLWSKRWYRTFDKWIKALAIEYEPLWNFDRTEEYTDTESETIDRDTTDRKTETETTSGNKSETENTTANGNSETIGHSETSDTVDETDTNSVVAYNSDTLHLKEQDVIDRDGSSENNDKINSTAETEENRTLSGDETGNRTLTDNSSGTDNSDRNRTLTHHAKLYGNIGVTTSQQMLESELEIAKFNLTQQIVDCFKVDMCILVY